MCSNKTVRIFLSFLLILGILSPSIFSPVQADTTSSAVTLSSAITAKLDAFIVKVQALRPKYTSDADWNTFLVNLNSKVNALKPQYTGNTLILAVLDRLSAGVIWLKNPAISTSSSFESDADLCAQQGLSNIDETNWTDLRPSHVSLVFPPFKDNPIHQKTAWGYKMLPGESYSFPIDTSKDGMYTINDNAYYRNTYPVIMHISDKKCDFGISSRFGKEYFNVSFGGSHHYYSVDSKYADPDYVPPTGIVYDGSGKVRSTTTSQIMASRSPHLVTGKKYYMNVRWIRTSDIIEDNGNLKTTIFGMDADTWTRVASYAGGRLAWLSDILGVENISTLTKSKLNTALESKFNIKGDVCLDSQKCNIALTFSEESPMSVISPERWAAMKGLIEDDRIASGKFNELYNAEMARKKAIGDTSPIPESKLIEMRSQAGLANKSPVCEVGPCN